jgi:hypothetical protein
MYLRHPFLLALTEVLLLKQILQTVVIGLDHEFASHQILSELGQGMHDCQHLLVINGVQPLRLTDPNGSPHVKELLNLCHVDFKVATKVFKWIKMMLS